MELLVLEHHPGTGACRFEDVLDARTSLAPWRTVDVTAHGALEDVDLAQVAGLVVMGGPQSVADGADHPWLGAEQALLRTAIAAEVPVLAVCLGAQVLATATGGEVSRRERPRVGYQPLTRVGPAADGDEGVMAGWPDGAATLLFHEDEVAALPPGAEPLLAFDDGAPVAWRLGSAVATQAHPEVDAAQLGRWVEDDGLAALLTEAGVDGTALAEEAARRDRIVRPLGQAMVGRFVDGPVRRRVTGSAR